jgi:hypothetical protein
MLQKILHLHFENSIQFTIQYYYKSISLYKIERSTIFVWLPDNQERPSQLYFLLFRRNLQPNFYFFQSKS